VSRRHREVLAHALTWALAFCAFASTVIVVRREFAAKPQSRPRASIVSDWKRFASGHVLRDSGAAITIVVFSDFQCPFCKRFSEHVDSLRSEGRAIRVLFRHAPSAAHPYAIAAARSAECAAAQHAFDMTAFRHSTRCECTWRARAHPERRTRARRLVGRTVSVQALLLAALMSSQVIQSQSPTLWRLVRDMEGPERSARSATEFTQVQAIVPLGPLAAVVLEGRPAGLGVYGPGGQQLRTVGRLGRGPGEYEVPHQIGVLGDTIWVTETRARRTTLFTRHGELLTTSVWGLPGAGSTGQLEHGVILEGLLGDGTAWGARDHGAAILAQPPEFKTLLRLGRDGRVLDTIATVSTLGAMFGIGRDDGGVSFGRQPFSDAALAVCGAGPAACFLIDRRVSTQRRRGSFSVTAVNAVGDTLWSHSFNYTPRRLEKTIRDSVLSIHERRLLRSGATRQQIRAALFLPEHSTPISAAFAGRDGFLWLARELGDATTEYWILDPGGRLVAATRMPANVSIRAASDGYAWAVETDSDDIQRVTRYRVTQ